jgi:PQQ-like domain
MKSLTSLRTAALAAVLLAAGCGGIQHSNVVSPQVLAAGKIDTAKLGEITSMRVANGKLYVGAQKGLASLDASGKVLWEISLPEVTARMVAADAQNIAVSSYSVVGLDAAEGAKAFFLGNLGNEPKFANAVVALFTEGGKPVWAVNSPEQTALSAPALSPVSVGVGCGTSFAVFQRANGSVVAPPMADITGFLGGVVKGMVAQAVRNRPVVFKDAFYVGFFTQLGKYDFSGKQISLQNGFGLFSPFENITVGPVVIEDKYLVFGTDRSTGNPGALFGADAEPSKEFKEAVKDKLSDPGSLYVVGDHLFVATNFHVVRFQDDGDVDWDVVNKKGGLYPSSFRGVRYVDGNLATRKSQADLMVATDDSVFVTSTHDDKDVITVLSAKSGEYVHTLNIGKPIVELGIIGDKLAVASFDGVDFLPLK